KRHGLQIPDVAGWMGSGLDTARKFRNIHAYPIIQTKNDLMDFVMGDHMLNGKDLYRISKSMDLEPETDEKRSAIMKALFKRFKNKNARFQKTLRIVPDSILQKYTAQ
ncbi:MAG: phosphoglycerol transferase, partial [Sediminibacterium sp.]|nr:phosphoglycerol transferase [Sediminibacterium sp.]